MRNNDETTEPEALQLVRELAHAPLAQVVPSTAKPRLDLEEEPFEALKRGIHINGLLKPIVVRPRGDVYEIVDGHRRFAAVHALAVELPRDKRFKSIAVTVANVADALMPIVQLAENVSRSDLSVLEIGDVVARAIEGGVAHETITRTLGWNRRQLNRHLQIHKAPMWLRRCALDVKLIVSDVDDREKPVIDPHSGKPAERTVPMSGLPFTAMFELVTLYRVLIGADLAELAKEPGERALPRAKAVVGTLIARASAEQWTIAKLRAEIARVKDPNKPHAASTPVKPLLSIAKNRCVIELGRAASLTANEREDFAQALTKVLEMFGFKDIIIGA